MKIKELLKDKKFKNYLIIGMFALIVIIVLIVVVTSLVGGHSSNYSVLEGKLISAAKEYYSDNADLLPKEVGSEVSVSTDTLYEGKYIKSMEKLSPNGSTCTGKVIVSNPNGNYLYNAYVDCGENYKTISLGEYILNNSSIVESGDGLYKIGEEYIFRGEDPNNYIKFANKSYRIMRINADKSVTLIANERYKDDRPSWDDRFNSDKGYSAGINDYKVSRIKDALLTYVNSSVFTDTDRSKLKEQSLCIGKISEDNAVIYGMECNDKLDSQIIGLASVSEFAIASIDSMCIYALDGNCQNYNYLSNFGHSWWTLTASNETSYQVFINSGDSGLDISNAYSMSDIREVITLDSGVVYMTGNGTLASNYEIK